MGSVIYNNLAALQTNNQLNKNMKLKNTSSGRIASGEKFSSPGGSAAEYQISERMRVQLRSLDQNVKNVNYAKNLCEVAMGGLSTTTEILKTFKAKCLEAANGIYTEADLVAMEDELRQAIDQISDIANTTEYNGTYPLLASSGAYQGTMVINNNAPFNNGAFSPVVNVDGAELKVCDNGAGGDNFNELDLYVNGNGEDITTHSGWSTMEKVDDKTWSRTLHYVSTDGVDLNLTQKATLKDVFSDAGIKIGEAYFTTYEIEDNGGAPATIDLVYILDTDLYTGGNAPRNEQYKDSNGNVITKKSIYSKAAGNMPDSFENWSGESPTYGICGNITVEKGINGPDALLLSEYGRQGGLNDIKNGNILPENINGEDLVYEMAWFDKSLTNGPLVFDTGSYGFRATERANPSVWIQSGTTSNDGFGIELSNVQPESLGIEPFPGLRPRSNAVKSLELSEKACAKVLKMSTSFGAFYNRCMNSQGMSTLYQENLTAAESTIRDADIAKEVTDNVKHGVLAQASQAMLAQANSSSQMVLSLLS